MNDFTRDMLSIESCIQRLDEIEAVRAKRWQVLEKQAIDGNYAAYNQANEVISVS